MQHSNIVVFRQFNIQLNLQKEYNALYFPPLNMYIQKSTALLQNLDASEIICLPQASLLKEFYLFRFKLN